LPRSNCLRSRSPRTSSPSSRPFPPWPWSGAFLAPWRWPLPPGRLRGRLVAARAKVIFADWWRQGSGRLLEEFASLVERATREGEAAVRQRLATLEAEILHTLDAAEKLRHESTSRQAGAIAQLEQALAALARAFPLPSH